MSQPFTLQMWRTAAQHRLQILVANIGQQTPGPLYGALCAATVYPLIEISRAENEQMNFPAVLASHGLFGAISNNLMAEQMSRWHTHSEAELAEQLTKLAQESPDWRNELDLLLEKFEVLETIQTSVSQVDRNGFVQLLHRSLMEVGSRLMVQGDLIKVGSVTGSTGVAIGKQITQIINYYRQPDEGLDEATLGREIQTYLAWISRRYGQVTLRGMQRLVDLPLVRIYVPLSATAYTYNQWEENLEYPAARSAALKLDEEQGTIEGHRRIEMNQLLSLGKRIVVTGGPGSGKTTVLQQIAWTLATALLHDNVTLAQEALGLADDAQSAELPIPVILPLSIYTLARRHSQQMGESTLARVIESYLAEHHVANLLPKFFARLLHSGRYLMLLLDGLDEVPDENERIHVRQAIERLADGNTDLRMVVTCRATAYRGRTTLGRNFHEVHVEPLDTEHVEHLVQQAYGALYTHDAGMRQRQIAELLKGIHDLEAERRLRLGDKVRPLIDSPLMVRLLLIVHLNERRFPHHRVDLYQRATNNLLWPEYGLQDVDALEQIRRYVGQSHETHRKLVQHIAWEMHKRGDEQGREIEEDALRRLLLGAGQSVELAERFLQLTQLRGTLLEEQMGLYRFTHMAFQEFMVARYLAEVVRGEGGIEAIVRLLHGEKMVMDSWWREPILLLIGYLSMNARRNARTLISLLVDKEHVASFLPDQQVAAVELAGSACLEWFGEDIALRTQIAAQLTVLVNDADLLSAVMPSLRAPAGIVLGQLGDLRPGVGVKNGLPDVDWLHIEAGPFQMGATQERCSLIVEPYAISRYPVTMAQFELFIQDDVYAKQFYWTEAGWGWRTSAQIDGPENYSIAQQSSNQPQVGVSWYEAMAFCRWLSAQLDCAVELPNEIEWERAARGIDGRNFPWGEEFDIKRCNMLHTGIGSPSPVGLFHMDNAPCGAADMAGNVWEWCSNAWQSKLDPRAALASGLVENSESDVRRVLRGGSYANQRQFVRCAKRHRDYPSHRGPNVGFRIVKRERLSCF